MLNWGKLRISQGTDRSVIPPSETTSNARNNQENKLILHSNDPEVSNEPDQAKCASKGNGASGRAQSLTERLKKLNDKFIDVEKNQKNSSMNTVPLLDNSSRRNFQLVQNDFDATLRQGSEDKHGDDETTDDDQVNEENSPIISRQCRTSQKASEESSLSQDSPIICSSSDRQNVDQRGGQTQNPSKSIQIPEADPKILNMTEKGFSRNNVIAVTKNRVECVSAPVSTKNSDECVSTPVSTNFQRPKPANLHRASGNNVSHSCASSAHRIPAYQVRTLPTTVAEAPEGHAAVKSTTSSDISATAIKKFSVFSNGQISKTLLRSGFTAPELRAVCEYLGDKMNIEDEGDTNLATLGKEALIQLVLIRLTSERPSAVAPACIFQSQGPSKKRKDPMASADVPCKSSTPSMIPQTSSVRNDSTQIMAKGQGQVIMNCVSDDDKSSERTQPETRMEFDANSKIVPSKRYLPPGWCALLCKIKNQSICKNIQNHEHSSRGALDKVSANAEAGFDAKSGAGIRIQLSSHVQVTAESNSYCTNSFKIYLRPILPRSRPNLWRRTTEFLAERNQLP